MASGEHVVEDLFGFAELTGEATSTCINKKADDSHKFHFEKEKIKRDTDEVVVPIFFEKSGVKKYKVLARHQVEDDEDIRRPDSAERESPNSQEQRKENINIDQKNENGPKYKTEALGLVKKPKVKKVEKRKEYLVKDLKQSLNASKLKGELNKVNRIKCEGKKKKSDNKKGKGIECSGTKDIRSVSNETCDEADSSYELKMICMSKADNENHGNSLSKKQESFCKITSQEKQEIVQKEVVQIPLKVKCHVKLKRDPSIENFYKTKSDTDCRSSNNTETIDNGFKAERENEGRDEYPNRSPSVEEKSISRQSSADDSLIKAADMIYNVDIQVRKSGRLKSAKCASRYRGDYGIRVDTYKQLVNRTAASSSNLNESCEKLVIDKDASAPVTEKSIENECAIGNQDSLCEETTDAKMRTDIEEEMVPNKEVQNKIDSAGFKLSEGNEEEARVIDEKVNIETDGLEKSSDQFTVIKELLTENNVIYEKNLCVFTGIATKSFSVKDTENEMLKETGFEQVPERDDLKASTDDSENSKEMVDGYENKTSNTIMDSGKIHVLAERHKSDSNLKASEMMTNVCSYEVNEVRNRTFAQFDSEIKETECSEEVLQVPCSDMVEGSKPCTCDKKPDNNSSQCMENIKGRVCVKDLRSETKYDETSQKSGSKYSPESQRALGNVDVDDSVRVYLTKSKYSDKEPSGYVHSVGKSVNKMQTRIKRRKQNVDLSVELTEKDKSPECSPVKDPTKILECLRQRLFESAGADLVEADKATKQFESKLISSKQRQSMMDSNSTEAVDLEKVKQAGDNDSSIKSGKSTPNSSTLRQEVGNEILEEVAKSLNVLHQTKRKSDNVTKVGNIKRQRFEDKKFMLRSMIGNSDVDDPNATSQLLTDENCLEKSLFARRIAERTRSFQSSCETSSFPTQKVQHNHKSNDTKLEKGDMEHNKINSKFKPVKCSACSHIFKTKELLRKHFPCRIRQTRTWSQNKLRPNRAVKRIENGSKKFVCKLPKAGKPDPSKPRPQLLTYRKTKFRRVKGKRRRKLYQLIQDLRQKRNPVKWHHLSILYDDLSFKEQCLYKLGLICIGNASEGLERYTAEDITVFEQHRAQEKWLTEDARNFLHSIPDISKPSPDFNASTEVSTDNQESDFFSPKHVIDFPQEKTLDANCDNGLETEDEKFSATNQMSVDKANEKFSNDLSIISQSETRDCSKSYKEPCYVFYQGIEENEDDTNTEEIVELKNFETFNANVSIQKCMKVTPYSEIDLTYEKDENLTCVEGLKTLIKDAQTETFTAVTESNLHMESAQELSPESVEVISIESSIVQNNLKQADISERMIKDTFPINTNEANIHEPKYESVNDKNTICHHNLVKENSGDEGSAIKESMKTNTCMPLTASVRYNEKNRVCEGYLNSEDKDIGLENKVLEEKESVSMEDEENLLSDSGKKMSESAQKSIHRVVPESKDTHLNTLSSNVQTSSFGVITYNPVTKVSAIRKSLAGPDIELFHRTATIDDKFLTEKLTIKEKTSKKENCEGETKSSKFETELDSNILHEANGNMDGIVKKVEDSSSVMEDVEESVIENTNEIDSNNLNVTTFSPVKGILKKSCPEKENDTLPSLKQNVGFACDEIIEKSPKKKKIDFKTYAKRKGLIKEDDGKSKVRISMELHHKEMVAVDNTKDIDDSDKECMRSEPNQEIEDDFLGRLLDAVNLIDSIIEEQKEQIDLEEHVEETSDLYSAITPEMAFNALIDSKTSENNGIESLVCKPYDIESVYPYSRVDGENVSEEMLNSTDLLSMCGNVNLDKSCAENNSEHFESVQYEILPDAYSNMSEDLDNVCEASIWKSHTDGMKENTEILKEEDDVKDLNEHSSKTNKDVQSLLMKEVNINLNIVEVAQSKIRIKESMVVEHDFMSKTEIQDYEENNEIIREIDVENYDVSENTDIETGNTHYNTNQDIEKIDIDTDQCLSQSEKSNSDVKEPFASEKLFENKETEKVDNCNNFEILKSPEQFRMKEIDKENENTAIKESKRDFTIKYEMNGIVVKENLLTGDKNVVENSSPFRSSAESESNYDYSSQSELDVSSVIDSGVGFDKDVLLATGSPVECYTKTLENNENDACLNIENKEKEISTIKGLNNSTEMNLTDKEQREEEPDHIQNAKHYLTLDKHTEENVHMKNDNRLDVEDQSTLIKEAVNDIKLDAKNFSDEQPDISDNLNQEMTLENITDKQLLVENSRSIKNIFDDNSVGSPPILEKVEVSEESIDEQDEELDSPASILSLEGEPPLLEPQHLEEDECKKVVLAQPQYSEENKKESCVLEMKEVKQDRIIRQERHFLDILDMVGSETKETSVFSTFGNKLDNFNGNGLPQSHKVHNAEFVRDDSTFNEDIGRNFSDVISEPMEVPMSPNSKLQCLFDKSECSDITMTQIKDVLSPFSKKGKKKSIPKESLLKIKSDITNLILKGKSQVGKDLKWLKTDNLSECTKSFNDEENIGEKVETNNTDDDRNTEVHISLIVDPKPEVIKLEHLNEGSVEENILQMLDSLEGKGSVAENMSSLLEILAENLKFLGNENIDIFDSESVHSYSEDTNLTCISSTESTHKELIADYLDEGEQPPSLDDIPIASNLECIDTIDFSEDFEEKTSETNPSDDDIIDKHMLDNSVLLTGEREHESKRINEETVLQNESNDYARMNDIQVINAKKQMCKSTLEGNVQNAFNFESSEDSLTLTCEHSKDDKHKATTIFKSITELNSIETDEESTTDELFDPVTMSARLSDLKLLTKENNRWEFNSDFNSDDEKLDYYDSDYDNDMESETRDAIEVSRGADNLLKGNNIELEEIKSSNTENHGYSLELFESQDNGSEKAERCITGREISNKENSESYLCSKTCVTSDDSSMSNSSLRYDKITEKEENLLIEVTNGSPESFAVLSKTNTNCDNEHAFKGIDDVEKANTESSIEKAATEILENIHESRSSTKAISEPLTCISSKALPQRYRADNIFTSLEKEIKEATVDTCSDTGKQALMLTGISNDNDNVDSRSLKAIIKLFSDNENDLSEDENLEDEYCHTDSKSLMSEVGSINKVIDMKDINETSTSKTNEGNDNLTTDKHDAENIGEEEKFKLILETDVSNENQDELVERRERVASMSLQYNLSTDKIVNNLKQTSQNYSVLSDEDTTDTVKYEDNVDVDTDFSDKNNDEVNKDKSNEMRLNGDNNRFCTLEQDTKDNLGEVDLIQKNQIDSSLVMDNKISSLLQENGSADNTDENCFKNEDASFDKIDSISSAVIYDGDKDKVRSVSLNIDDDFSDNFCESIAEKVKRKQRERSKSVCYNFNPWLYYSAAYVREVTKPAKKEFSVFRSSILEKRAREKSFSPDKEFSSSTRKKRNSSVPKEAKYETTCESDHIENKRMDHHSNVQIKPCSVLINKLNEDVILKYTRRKRKYEESTTENRPPIKVTIKLSQIVYPPPNSPYGSTSTSSDNYRSGYESCSEESETDNMLESEPDKDFEPDPMVVEDVYTENNKAEVTSREPLKIKIRKVHAKENTDEEKQNLIYAFGKTEQINDFVRSFNKSSSEGNIKSSSVEQIESEVLQDIERECEKVKSQEDNVMFYLSETDSDSEEKKLGKQKSENEDIGKEVTFGLRTFSQNSVQAVCGESDIDLSDSDTDFTDSELQEKIDKILNSKSSDDCSEIILKDDENIKRTLPKGKSSLMKMIVSDLRLSESESESEFENSVKTNEYIELREKDLVQENCLKGCIPLECKEIELKDKLSQNEILPQLNATEKVKLSNRKDESIDKQTFEDTEQVGEIHLISKMIEAEPSSLQSVTSDTYHKENGVLPPEQVFSPGEIIQDVMKSSDQNISRILPDEGHAEKEITPIQSNSDIIMLPIDLSINSMNNTSTRVACKETTEVISNKIESCSNLFPNTQHLHQQSWTPEETINEVASPNAIADKVFQRSDLDNASTDLSVTNDSVERADSSKIGNLDELNQQTRGEILGGIEEKVGSDLNNLNNFKKMDFETHQMTVHGNGQECIEHEIGNDVDKSEEVRESAQTSQDIKQKNVMLEEDTKQLENVSAVKNLEEDIFHDVQPINNVTEDEMIYYAVELSDDLETSEAVVNLETVELIDGPIIVESNETHEENVIDTNVIQSHTNDQFGISNETLNEQIVEIINEPKISDESRINCTLENITPIQNVTVNDSKSKYLYGINEDSQSSNEVVEELVTELVNDNAVIEEGHMSEEKQQVFHGVESWEASKRNDQFPYVVQQGSENSHLDFGNEITVSNVESFVRNIHIVSESLMDQQSRNEHEQIQISGDLSTKPYNFENIESNINEDRYIGTSGGIDCMQEYDNNESSAMVIDEGNDYIITQNEHTDDDDDNSDDEDDNAMETE